MSLAFLLNREGDCEAALDQARQGLRLYRAARRPYGEAIALNAVGWYNTMLDREREGLSYCEQALAIQQRIGDLSGQAWTLGSIANAHERLDNQHEALHYHRNSLNLARQSGLRDLEADALVHIGEICSSLGDSNSAVNAWRQALIILEDIDCRSADQVRRELNNLLSTMGCAVGNVSAMPVAIHGRQPMSR